MCAAVHLRPSLPQTTKKTSENSKRLSYNKPLQAGWWTVVRSGWPSNAVRVAIFFARCHRQQSMRNSSIGIIPQPFAQKALDKPLAPEAPTDGKQKTAFCRDHCILHLRAYLTALPTNLPKFSHTVWSKNGLEGCSGMLHDVLMQMVNMHLQSFPRLMERVERRKLQLVRWRQQAVSTLAGTWYPRNRMYLTESALTEQLRFLACNQLHQSSPLAGNDFTLKAKFKFVQKLPTQCCCGVLRKEMRLSSVSAALVRPRLWPHPQLGATSQSTPDDVQPATHVTLVTLHADLSALYSFLFSLFHNLCVFSFTVPCPLFISWVFCHTILTGGEAL